MTNSKAICGPYAPLFSCIIHKQLVPLMAESIPSF